MKADKAKLIQTINAFVQRTLNQMPTPQHKWLLGGVLASGSVEQAAKAFEAFRDDAGLYDTDKMAAFFDGAFRQSQTLEITLFGGGLASLLAPKLTLKFNKADADRFVQELSR